jgi:hypothetical protein
MPLKLTVEERNINLYDNGFSVPDVKAMLIEISVMARALYKTVHNHNIELENFTDDISPYCNHIFMNKEYYKKLPKTIATKKFRLMCYDLWRNTNTLDIDTLTYDEFKVLFDKYINKKRMLAQWGVNAYLKKKPVLWNH